MTKGSRPTSQNLPPDVANITASMQHPDNASSIGKSLEQIQKSTRTSNTGSSFVNDQMQNSSSIGKSDNTSYGRPSLSSMDDEEEGQPCYLT